MKGPKAFDALSKLTANTSWRNRIESAGLRGLFELGDKRAFEPAYRLATDASRPIAVRLAAIAVVSSTGKGDPRAFPLIFDRFRKALDAQDFDELVRALESLIELADPRGQQAFDLMKAKFKDDPALMSGVNFYEQQFKAALKK